VDAFYNHLYHLLALHTYVNAKAEHGPDAAKAREIAELWCGRMTPGQREKALEIGKLMVEARDGEKEKEKS